MNILDQLREKHKQLNSENKNSNSGDSNFLDKFLRIESGKNVVRILPWKDDSKTFYSESSIHRIESDDDKILNYHCRKIQNEACPLCDTYFSLWKMHKELSLPKGKKSKFGNLATKIRATPRYYMNVISRKLMEENASDPSKALKILSCGQKLFTKILNDVVDPNFMDEENPEDTTILSLKRGNDYIIELTNSGEYNNYDSSKTSPKKTKAGSDKEIAVWMETLHDIHNLIKIGDYEDGRKIGENLLASLHNVEKNSGYSEGLSDKPKDEIEV